MLSLLTSTSALLPTGNLFRDYADLKILLRQDLTGMGESA
jgi:hypothetical protein